MINSVIKSAIFITGLIFLSDNTFALPSNSPAWTNAPAWTATSHFTPPTNAEAGAPFAGQLELTTAPMETPTNPEGKFIQHPWAWWGIFDFLAKQEPDGAAPLFELDAGLFPGLDLGFVTTSDGDLIPTERTLIRRPLKDRTKSFWELTTGPGKSWKIADGLNKGWSRAAFPVSLVQSQEGEAWVGLASFDYKGEKVTPLKVAFGPMSAGGFIFWDADFDVVAWGEVPATYAGPVKNASKLKVAWEAEKAADLPVRPLSDLKAPSLTKILEHENLLTVAILKDGTLYRAPVETPFGTYPYPDSMRVGVWSISKSLVSGIAALRIAEKYETDFLERPLVSFFKEGKEFNYADQTSKARLQEVTIRDALHMETGMGPTGYDTNWALENTNTYEWGYSYAPAVQIQKYFSQTPNPDVAGSGEKFTYIDQDMWAANVAMDRYLKEKEGPAAGIVKMLSEEVYTPIGSPHFTLGTTYTKSGKAGLPYAAWGVLPTIETLANAGKLIANGGKGPNGSQILHAGLTEAMFANDAYSFAFWKQTPTINDAKIIVPEMSGSGGNHVLMLENGTIAIVLSRDSYNVEWTDAELADVIEAALSAQVK